MKAIFLPIIALSGVMSLNFSSPPNKKQPEGKIEFRKNLDHPFFHEYKWDYPWYVIPNDDGTFENTLGDSISKEDTLHLTHTAASVSSHQGEHNIRYCFAQKKGKEILLHFEDGLPAYGTTYFIRINGKKFTSEMSVNYIFPTEHLNIITRPIHQQLILDPNSINQGDSIRGIFDLTFEETHWEKGRPIYSDTSKFSGVFKAKME